ncbi:MAG: response regulator [Desulfobaccales bacterium]
MTQVCASTPPDGPPRDLFAPLQVLVVDDIPAIRRLLTQMLQQLGVASPIRQAADGLEAWELLQERLYDVVVCDINMPRMTGLELLKRLRGHPRYEHTPFLLITGEVAEEIVAAAVESEVDGYLLKPFRLPALQRQLTAILKGRHFPGPGERLIQEAQRCLAAGFPHQALDLLHQLPLPRRKKSARVLNLLGECLQARDSPHQAARCFQEALKINPYHQQAAANLAALLSRLSADDPSPGETLDLS